MLRPDSRLQICRPIPRSPDDCQIILIALTTTVSSRFLFPLLFVWTSLLFPLFRPFVPISLANEYCNGPLCRAPRLLVEPRGPPVHLLVSCLLYPRYGHALYRLRETTVLTLLGYSIRSYRDDENIPLLVNKVYSDTSQLQYAYFDLPFVCPPTGNKHHGSSFASGHSVPLNLGEVLRGDRIKTSDLGVNMGQDIDCQYLCDRVVGRKDMVWAQQLIEGEYVTEWILDNLPGATSFVTVDRSRKYYAAGFKMGYKDFDGAAGQERYHIYNHYILVVRWRPAPGRAGNKGAKVVVGFEVYPKSIAGGHRNETGCPLDVSGDQDPFALYIPGNNTNHWKEQFPDSSYIPEEVFDLDDGASLTIPYTYSVYFREETEVEWSNRWDLYFNDQTESSFTHWLAIINSLIISGILGAVCIVIWGRTMQGDVKGRGDGVLEEARLRITRRGDKKKSTSGLLEKISETGPEDDLSSDDEPLEEISGWKLLHGDVFRPPPYGGLLAPLVGSGMQLVFMVVGLLGLSCAGILNPSWRGGFWSVGVGLFVFAGGFSGYFSARVYKTFGGQNWRKNTMMVSSDEVWFCFRELTWSFRRRYSFPGFFSRSYLCSISSRGRKPRPRRFHFRLSWPWLASGSSSSFPWFTWGRIMAFTGHRPGNTQHGQIRALGPFPPKRGIPSIKSRLHWERVSCRLPFSSSN